MFNRYSAAARDTLRAGSALQALALLGAGLGSVAAFAAPAAAQEMDANDAQSDASADASQGGGDIVVTGSRIRRANYDTEQPTMVVGSEQIANLGVTNIADSIQSLPAFGPPSSGAGSQTGAFGSGQSFSNMFGLGTQRTLTLVNGRRYVSSNTASIFGPTSAGSQVDLNTIPTLLVDRVETVAVGGAPIYGSDAIAGTVNIILKDHYQGVKLDAQYGIAEEGDAPEYRLSAIAGTSFAGGRGNIVAAFDYNKQQGLLYSDRARTAKGLFFAAPADSSYPFDKQLISDRRIPILSQNGIPLVDDFVPLGGSAIQNAQGQALKFDSNGNLIPIDFGSPTGSITNSAGGNGYSLVPLSNLSSPVERYLGNVQANYQLTDGIRAFGEFSYANSKGTELRSQPVYNTALFDDAGTPDGNLIVPLSNPFLSDSARQTIAANLAARGEPGQDFFYLGRANEDIVSGRGSSTVELYRFVGGFDGDADIANRNIHWEIVGNYGRSKTRGSARSLVQQNFENALGGCQAGIENSPIDTISSQCVAFNPFGQQNSSAVADYITTIAHPTALNKQWVVTADMSGDLLNIWGGNTVNFALGYEHREEKANFDPGAYLYGVPNDGSTARQSYGRSAPIDPVNGKYNTDEIFGELLVPLVSPSMGIPGVNLLEAHGAARYVDNSIAGGDLTWTAGGRYKPIRDLTIRGNFTRSIRAPSVTELFNPNSSIFTTADDPCDARYLNSGPNPGTRQANCAAAGLPADFKSNIVDFTQRGSLSGNTNLQNEVADSWTIGAIVEPRFVPGLALSVDWVSIDLSDAILSIDADQTMEACYDSPNYPNNFCGQFTRGADGQVEFIRTGYQNAASFKFQGLMASLNYARPTPFLGASSQVSLAVQYQYTDKNEQRVGLGDLSTYAGAVGYSKHKGTARVSYQNDWLGAYTQIQYIGSAVIDPDAAPTAYDHYKIDDVAYVDLGLSFKVQENYTLRLIVENLFDTNAPYPVPAGGGVATYFDGLRGRYLKAAVSVGF